MLFCKTGPEPWWNTSQTWELHFEDGHSQEPRRVSRQMPHELVYPSFSLLTFNRREYNLRASRYIQWHVPLIKTKFGMTAFTYNAPVAGNEIQRSLKHTVFISLTEFKSYLNQTIQFGQLLIFISDCFFLSLLITFVCPMLIVCCYLGQCSLVKEMSISMWFLPGKI